MFGRRLIAGGMSKEQMQTRIAAVMYKTQDTTPWFVKNAKIGLDFSFSKCPLDVRYYLCHRMISGQPINVTHFLITLYICMIIESRVIGR